MYTSYITDRIAVSLHSANYVTSAARCRLIASHVPVTVVTLVLSMDWTTETPHWPSSIPITSSQSVLNAAARLLYHMRSADHITDVPSLAARPRANRIQGRCTDVQSSTPKCAAVLGTTRSYCRSARPTDITLWWHQSSVDATYQAFNSRRPGFLRLLDAVSGTLCRRR